MHLELEWYLRLGLSRVFVLFCFLKQHVSSLRRTTPPSVIPCGLGAYCWKIILYGSLAFLHILYHLEDGDWVSLQVKDRFFYEQNNEDETLGWRVGKFASSTQLWTKAMQSSPESNVSAAGEDRHGGKAGPWECSGGPKADPTSGC